MFASRIRGVKMIADLILKNLHAVSFAHQDKSVELIAIKGNKIIYAGDTGALGDLKSPDTCELDCCGGLVIPGFNDAHCHVYAFAATTMYADCSKARSIADIQAVLRERTSNVERGQWVRAANCDFSGLDEGRFPNRQDLDSAVFDLPVLLLEHSGQHCVLNSLALKACGITEDSPNSAFGTELADGVVSASNERVANAIPPLSEQDIESGMQQVSNEYLSLGITSIQDTSWSNRYHHWLTMKNFKDRGVLKPRLTLLPGADALTEFQEQGLKTGSGNDHMRVGAVKIALDESMNLLSPPQDVLNSIALKTHLAGFQLAFHVSDSDMLQASLHALQFIRETTPIACVRPRFEHCPICPPTLLPKLVEYGVTVVTQPNLFYENGPRFLHALSNEELKSVYPYRSFVEHSIPLAFSSDSPLTPCNPFFAIPVSVTRKVSGDASLSPHEGISFLEVLKGYTYGGAYASCEEQIKGSIAVGMLADLVVLDCDPLAMNYDTLGETKPIATLIDGKVVWER